MATSIWQVQEAKAKFSQVVERAQTEGPQVITSRGVERAVVVSLEDFRKRFGVPKSTPERPFRSSEELLAFLRSAPAFEIPDRHKERLKNRKARAANR